MEVLPVLKILTVFSWLPLILVTQIRTAAQTDLGINDGEKYVEKIVRGDKVQRPDFLLFTAPFKLCDGCDESDAKQLVMEFPLHIGTKAKNVYLDMYVRDQQRHSGRTNGPFKKRTTRWTTTTTPGPTYTVTVIVTVTVTVTVIVTTPSTKTVETTTKSCPTLPETTPPKIPDQPNIRVCPYLTPGACIMPVIGDNPPYIPRAGTYYSGKLGMRQDYNYNTERNFYDYYETEYRRRFPSETKSYPVTPNASSIQKRH